jgi:tetratricopeptide (TPR) repeat protein
LFDEAITAFRKAVRLRPDNVRDRDRLAGLLNQKARSLGTRPDTHARNARQAVALAKEAVDLAPKNAALWYTLGAVHCRAGNWREAIMALEKRLELSHLCDSPGLFFLAMAHWHLGNWEEARKSYDQAVKWMEKNHSQNEVLRRLRAETAELLDVKGKR